MKKKMMQTLFVFLFVAGLVLGYLLPGDINSFVKKSQNGFKPGVFDVSKGIGQLEQESPYFKYSVLARTETADVELIRLDGKIPLHKNPDENHFVYVIKGRLKGTLGNVTSVFEPDQLVVVPSGVPHSFERASDSPVEMLLFTAPYIVNNTVFMEK